MSYDTTGPVKVNETKSLLVLILLVLLVGAGIAVALRLNPAAPAASQAAPAPAAPPAARSQTPGQRPPNVTQGSRPRGMGRRGGPVTRPPDPRGDFLRWPSDNIADAQGTTALKSGSVYLNISLTLRGSKRIIDVWRSYPTPESKPKPWATAYFVEHVLNNPDLAKRYDVTAEQLAQLKSLELKIPTLTPEQHNTIADLFTAAETARREKNKPAKPGATSAPASQPNPQKRAADAEAALLKAAASLVIPPADLDKLHEDAADAREILRPDQLDLIDSDFDRSTSNFDRPGYPRRQK